MVTKFLVVVGKQIIQQLVMETTSRYVVPKSAAVLKKSKVLAKTASHQKENIAKLAKGAKNKYRKLVQRKEKTVKAPTIIEHDDFKEFSELKLD